MKKPFDIIEVRQLAYSLSRKWKISAQLMSHLSNLEVLIKDRTAELEQSLALIRSTLESTADGIVVVDMKGNIVDFNQKFIDMWNIPPKMKEGKSYKETINYAATQTEMPDKFIALMNTYDKAIETEKFAEISLRNGRYYEIYSLPHKVRNNIVGRVWNFHDITERKKMQDELIKQATTDKLTGLPNRTLLYDRIEQAIIKSERTHLMFALLFLDIDRFKLINDNLGHTMGDLFLRAIAKQLSTVVRKSDTICRLGGDEFILLLVDLQTPEQIKIIADKVLAKVATPIEIENHKFSVTTSIGISIYPEDGKTAEDLLKQADTAMYSSKDIGGNAQRFFTKQMAKRSLTRLTMENDLRSALEHGEIVVFYQPYINLNSDKIAGVEALVRWQHPVLGLLPPDEFIPLAEESGLICNLGEQVLLTACKQNKKWQDEGLPHIKVSVNVSNKQLKLLKLDEVVERALNASGLDPKYLELELTESVIMDNTKALIAVINKIKDIGVSLAMDDFGTGYSSLSYLRRFPFDKLKIDKSFVMSSDTNQESAAIVQAIIAMAKGLKMSVTAEGMETLAQKNFLKNNKCLQAQGFLFSKPVKPEFIQDLLSKEGKIKPGGDSHAT